MPLVRGPGPVVFTPPVGAPRYMLQFRVGVQSVRAMAQRLQPDFVGFARRVGQVGHGQHPLLLQGQAMFTHDPAMLVLLRRAGHNGLRYPGLEQIRHSSLPPDPQDCLFLRCTNPWIGSNLLFHSHPFLKS